MMVWGGGASRKWLGHEEGALLNGIGALTNEAPQGSLSLFLYVRVQQEVCDRKGPPLAMLAPSPWASSLPNYEK